ncbi:MAG: hypothetical protein COV47_02165 [Candidatus Diapherotrites archaeon CG11_big_fil_rev_8_21_14_0_20_37_9]|nr:MAG: hypothetical protein COV47_02165 [Candidatus Diapherotrites archaeon CG11_big_fil_rev_8_21_14_0_20_37_9]
MVNLWPEKYFPSDFGEFTGNSEIVENAVTWAKSWAKGDKQSPLLLWGQTGSGKTALAYLIAKQFNWTVVELNSSDLRSKDAVERIVGAASQNASFFGSRRMILIDEVDAMARKDRGGASAMGSIIKSSQNPVILTANDIFANRNISNLRFVCRTFEFKKINYLSMAKALRAILDKEGIGYEHDAVELIAKNASGDMRSALLDSQTLSLSGKITMADVASLSPRERQQKVFSVMKAIFKGTSFSEVREIRTKTDLSSDLLFQWVDENISRQYSKPQDIALAYNRLSRADIFNGRIYRKQHWGFLRYSSELAAEGVALSKEAPYHDFVMYQFPQLLSMLSKTSSLRSMKKNLGKKIGAKTHSSSRKVISKDLPFLTAIFSSREKAVSLSAAFELNEDEVAFLLGTKPDTKKVQSIIAEASELISAKAKPKRFFYEAPVTDVDFPDSVDEKIPVEKDPAPDVKGTQTKLF